MSTNSINSNYAALVALQGLNQTTTELQSTQAKISSGLQVGSAGDNASVWAIAEDQRNTAGRLDAVKSSLQRAQSTLDVALSAGQTVSDLLNQIRAKVLLATDSSLDTVSRNALSSDVAAYTAQIIKVVSSADFNGASLVNTSATPLVALTDANASVFTVQTDSLTVGGPNITFTAGASFSTATQATALLALVDASIPNVNQAVSQLGASSNAISSHLTFVATFQDTLTQSVGSLVDADVAKESAALTALQVKQQLGVQTLSIANSSRDVLLSLFR